MKYLLDSTSEYDPASSSESASSEPTSSGPASNMQLLHFRIAAIAMASIVLLICVFCIVIIYRNTKIRFSFKVIAFVIVINFGFIFNQITSSIRNQTLFLCILQGVCMFMIT